MLKVSRYAIYREDICIIEMPMYSKVLSIGVQNEEVFLWALVDLSIEKTVPRRFRVAGTGHPITIKELEELTFLGTVFLYEVFHIFEIKESRLLKENLEALEQLSVACQFALREMKNQ